MKIDLQKRYDQPDDFFALEESSLMKLSGDAAISVCEQSARHGLVIVRIEGGVWHFPGFEARLDCIWDGVDVATDYTSARKNNLAASDFIRSELHLHDAFILTSLPIAPTSLAAITS